MSGDEYKKSDEKDILMVVCPICFHDVKGEEILPCVLCGYSLCAKCIQTMFYYDKWDRQRCPVCKCCDAYTIRKDADNIHLHIKLQKLQAESRDKQEDITRRQQGCCIIS